VHAVGFAEVAGRAAGHVAASETPGQGVAGADRVGVAGQAEDLRAEGVQAQAAVSQRAHDLFHLSAVLATANTPDPDPRQRGQVDTVPLVEVRAALVC
jgi:hypothetical protein